MLDKHRKRGWFTCVKSKNRPAICPAIKMLDNYTLMEQIFVLNLEKNLSVKFTFSGQHLEVNWSRSLVSDDLPILEEHYVPWRNDLLIKWGLHHGKRIDFADLPMIELVTRKARNENDTKDAEEKGP